MSGTSRRTLSADKILELLGDAARINIDSSQVKANAPSMTVPEAPDDDKLLRLVMAGDEDAFVRLYRRRQGGIYRFALQMSGSETIAEDVTQEVFMVLMQDAGRYNAARGSVSAYLYGIARNLVLRQLRNGQHYVPLGPGDEEAGDSKAEEESVAVDPLSELARTELVEAVRRSVLSLPEHYREVVVLCELHELSYAETAATLGCSVGTVRSRLHRARALLVERLRPQGEAARPGAINAARCLV